MPSSARVYRVNGPRRRNIRKFKEGAASQALGKLTPGCEIFCLTYGQFSLIDAIVAIINQTGPAHVALATWSAAHHDLEKTHAMLASAQIQSMRFIVDRSFENIMPHYCRIMRELFGPQCIRTIKTHAKWCVIHNDDWHIVLRTSMNLNYNPRLENIEISDDAEFAAFFLNLADEIFAEVPPGITADGDLPECQGLLWDQPSGKATAGRMMDLKLIEFD